MPDPNRALIAEVLNDAGYVVGLVAGASWFANIHPDLAAPLGLAAVIALGLANRVNPPA